jgi:hypothetical protein
MLLWLLALFFVRCWFFLKMVLLAGTGTGSKKRNAANVADRGCFDG